MQKIISFSDFIEYIIEPCGFAEAFYFATFLTNNMVMMGWEFVAQLNFVLPALLDTNHYAQFFEQTRSTVDTGSVHDSRQVES